MGRREPVPKATKSIATSISYIYLKLIENFDDTLKSLKKRIGLDNQGKV